ncbi:hypothetical protein [Aquimarina macrocephali]|uniref:hypothetical protein n=1 Tax=Aquimarina macrocephali TaxID=666563 RepID=UPI000466EC75|nr:hypothetical protein [Aquimarina macrocephali]
MNTENSGGESLVQIFAVVGGVLGFGIGISGEESSFIMAIILAIIGAAIGRFVGNVVWRMLIFLVGLLIFLVRTGLLREIIRGLFD